MPLDILRRTGGWCVELVVPIRQGDRTIEQIEIKPPSIKTLTRWQRGQIPSSMALLAELSGISEALLVNITYPDADRVLLALFNIVPQAIKASFTDGDRPLASPEEAAPAPEPGQRPLADDDPRFPAADGPVVPLSPPPPPQMPPQPIPPQDGLGFKMDAPDVMRRVS
jgi:hypothetical protein